MSTRERALAAIRRCLGPEGATDDPAVLAPRLREWRDRFHGRALLLARPGSTAEVAEVMRLCHDARIAMVPQGGNTGLCGGAIPDASGTQLLLSLERMNRIVEVDALGCSLTAEAGCVLARLQQAAREQGRLFALSLASEGSAQIGGSVATNAGGTNVLRYGTAREQVLGLEVVLADGRVVDLLRGLRKDTAGYDLKQWFIGSEGTLGVITRVCVRLHVAPTSLQTALVAVSDPRQALLLLGQLRGALGDRLSAFELLPRAGLELVFDYLPDTADPLRTAYPWYVLLEAEGSAGIDLGQGLGDVLGGLLEERHLLDAVLATTLAQAQALWRLRDSLSAAQKHAGPSIKHDLALPLANMAEFIERGGVLAERLLPGAKVLAFGHVGDGNVHFNIGCPEGMDRERFLGRWEEIAAAVHDLAVSLGGTVAAEHGIGQLKTAELARLRGGIELELMRGLKHLLDPLGLMNPGKVLTDERIGQDSGFR